ncbi:hypothetical protein ERJ75_000220700 [Trypanosoma vivax]|nr:hypothetical protein ERJ75_000220700 [Trypanosoma vivax]
MMRWELGLVCNAVGSEGGRVAIRLALVTAGRCGEIALRLREGFVKHPGGRNTLTVDFGALQKSAQGGPGQSSALCVDCGRGGDQTQFGPENSDAAWEGRGTTGTVAQHRAAPGTLGRHFEQLREVDGPHVEDALGMAKLPRAPQKAVGEDRCQGRFLVGAVLWDALGWPGWPLWGAGLGTLPLEWARRRLNTKAPRRGVARCAPVAGKAFIKTRTEVENFGGGRQRNGEGRRHSRSAVVT